MTLWCYQTRSMNGKEIWHAPNRTLTNHATIPIKTQIVILIHSIPILNWRCAGDFRETSGQLVFASTRSGHACNLLINNFTWQNRQHRGTPDLLNDAKWSIRLYVNCVITKSTIWRKTLNPSEPLCAWALIEIMIRSSISKSRAQDFECAFLSQHFSYNYKLKLSWIHFVENLCHHNRSQQK